MGFRRKRGLLVPRFPKSRPRFGGLLGALTLRLVGEVVPRSIPKPPDRSSWVESKGSVYRRFPQAPARRTFKRSSVSRSRLAPQGTNGCGLRGATEAPWVLPAGHVGVCGWMAAGDHYPLDTRGVTEVRSRPLGRDGWLVSST